MSPPTPPKPPEELSRTQARRILAQMGENGKPPELGISHVNVGNESYLKIIDATYIQDLVCAAEGSSFKLVQGTYGAGKTHFLYCVRDLAWRRGLLTAFVRSRRRSARSTNRSRCIARSRCGSSCRAASTRSAGSTT